MTAVHSDARETSTAGGSLLAVDNLTVSFRTDRAIVRVVEDVSFTLKRGQTLGLVGESGCGKSVTAQSIMRLLPMPPAKIETGHVLLEGEDLVPSFAGVEVVDAHRLVAKVAVERALGLRRWHREQRE